MPSLTRRVGNDAVLVEMDSSCEVQRLRNWVLSQHNAVAGFSEIIPGARTLYLMGSAEALAWIERSLSKVELESQSGVTSRRIVVPVRYDGCDLFEVASRLGLTPEQVIEEHSNSEYRVDFFGFAPGQAFFSGVPPILQVPRRSSPRTRVPGGSVAIANEYCVIYPADAPGGWSLIGTRAGPPLWDATEEPPNRVSLGDTIAFQRVS